MQDTKNKCLPLKLGNKVPRGQQAFLQYKSLFYDAKSDADENDNLVGDADDEYLGS